MHVASRMPHRTLTLVALTSVAVTAWMAAPPVFTPVQPELFAAGGSFTNAWADYDGDGDADLFVGFNGTPNRLYRNDAGTFVDGGTTTPDAGEIADAGSTVDAGDPPVTPVGGCGCSTVDPSFALLGLLLVAGGSTRRRR